MTRMSPCDLTKPSARHGGLGDLVSKVVSTPKQILFPIAAVTWSIALDTASHDPLCKGSFKGIIVVSIGGAGRVVLGVSNRVALKGIHDPIRRGEHAGSSLN